MSMKMMKRRNICQRQQAESTAKGRLLQSALNVHQRKVYCTWLAFHWISITITGERMFWWYLFFAIILSFFYTRSQHGFREYFNFIVIYWTGYRPTGKGKSVRTDFILYISAVVILSIEHSFCKQHQPLND